MKRLLDQIWEDMNVLKDSKEVEIAKEYGKFTKRLTIILIRKKLFMIDFLDVNEWLIFTITLLKAVYKYFFAIQTFFSVHNFKLVYCDTGAIYSDRH